MNHAMIDLETLGIGIGAPLFEIGVCIFEPKERSIVNSYKINVDLLDVVLSTGFVPQKGTIDWWRTQDYDPWSQPRLALKDALLSLNHVLEEHGVTHVWGNSPSFDCVILETHYEAIGLKKPWSYSKELDFRTIKWLYRDLVGLDLGEIPSVKHNAREDAIQQTELLLKMLP